MGAVQENRREDSPLQVLSNIVQPIQEEPAQEYKTFYSKNAGLILSVSKGQRVVVDGEYTRVDEKLAEFQPQANHFGYLTTNDPELIRFLEKRILKEKDVMTPAQYNDAIMRPEDKIQQLNDRTRQLEDENRLLKMLAEKK